jgi:hypothetical protein
MNVSVVKITNKGGGYVIVTQSANDNQVSTEKIEKFVSGRMKDSYTLIAVNNSTTTMYVNPRMRDHRPDDRVYTLVLTSKIRKK